MIALDGSDGFLLIWFLTGFIPVVLCIWGYTTMRRKENELIAQGREEEAYIGGYRKSSVAAVAGLFIAGHLIKKDTQRRNDEHKNSGRY